MQSLVQLEVDELGELGGAQVAGVRLLARVQPQVGLEVGGRAEAFVADVALVRFLACGKNGTGVSARKLPWEIHDTTVQHSETRTHLCAPDGVSAGAPAG